MPSMTGRCLLVSHPTRTHCKRAHIHPPAAGSDPYRAFRLSKGKSSEAIGANHRGDVYALPFGSDIYRPLTFAFQYTYVVIHLSPPA